MKLYILEYGIDHIIHRSSNKEEILQAAINYIIPILEKKSTQSIDEFYLKCYIEIQNNNLEKAVEIYSTFCEYPYNLKYFVREPKALSNKAIELLDKQVKEMIFK